MYQGVSSRTSRPRLNGSGSAPSFGGEGLQRVPWRRRGLLTQRGGGGADLLPLAALRLLGGVVGLLAGFVFPGGSQFRFDLLSQRRPAVEALFGMLLCLGVGG